METNNQPQKNSPANLLGLFLALNFVWVVTAAFSIWLSWKNLNLTASGEITQGTVVRLIEDDLNAFTTDITPVFQFQVDGKTYEVKSQNLYGWWNRYLRFREGKQVEIRYDPANPENAEINSLWDIWIETVCLSSFTVLFAVGVNLYFVTRWRKMRA